MDEALQQFYEKLLAVLRHPTVRDGQWSLLECVPAWDGNGSWDCFLAFAWQDSCGNRLLVTVNYAPHPSQCYVRLPFPGVANHLWRLEDLTSVALYERDGNDLSSRGLYLDLPPWGYHVFEVKGTY